MHKDTDLLRNCMFHQSWYHYNQGQRLADVWCWVALVFITSTIVILVAIIWITSTNNCTVISLSFMFAMHSKDSFRFTPSCKNWGSFCSIWNEYKSRMYFTAVDVPYSFQWKDRLGLQHWLDKSWIHHYHWHLDILHFHQHRLDNLIQLVLVLKLNWLALGLKLTKTTVLNAIYFKE